MSSPEGSVAPGSTPLTAGRLLAIAGLLAISAVAWIFLWKTAVAMDTMQRDAALFDFMMAMMRPDIAARYVPAVGLMWVVMMIAMMTPAVLPLVTTFWRLARGTPRAGTLQGLTFASSYLVAWSAFGLLLTLLQWGLHRGAMLHSEVLAVAPQLGGGLLVATGVYQLTPFKASCLAHCQSPLGFLLSHWRDGHAGALQMGFTHGLYCLGCCWALMLLMFVGGVMSIGFMALVSLFILAERLLPPRRWATYVPGAMLIAWGGTVLLRTL